MICRYKVNQTSLEVSTLNLKLKDNNETLNQVTQSSYPMLFVTWVLDVASQKYCSCTSYISIYLILKANPVGKSGFRCGSLNILAATETNMFLMLAINITLLICISS